MCGPPPGSKCPQAISAVWNAGDFVWSAFLNSRGDVPGSGKSATPCERMQSAKATAACSICCVCAGVDEPSAPDELDVLEPQAAIIVAATIAAAAIGRFDLILDMAQVVSGRRSHECNTPAPCVTAL